MIKLEEYGFKKITEDERFEEYEGYGFNVTIYNYPYKTFENVELCHNTFVVCTKYTVSKCRPKDELENWLAEKNIKKI